MARLTHEKLAQIADILARPWALDEWEKLVPEDTIPLFGAVKAAEKLLDEEFKKLGVGYTVGISLHKTTP